MKTWLISDTHFGHHNIIKYCGRPINNNAIMWSNLFRSVGPEDTLIHGGDVCFATQKTASIAKEVFDWIPGKRKILIIGNHDRKVVRKQNWDEVHETYQFVYSGLKFHIQHFSFKTAENIGPGLVRFFRFFASNWCNQGLELPCADICIHGHIHNLGQRYIWVEETKQLVVNMCVEQWDYRPVCIDELVEEYNARKK